MCDDSATGRTYDSLIPGHDTVTSYTYRRCNTTKEKER